MSEGARPSWSKRGCGDSHRRGEAAGFLAARLKLVEEKHTPPAPFTSDLNRHSLSALVRTSQKETPVIHYTHLLCYKCTLAKVLANAASVVSGAISGFSLCFGHKIRPPVPQECILSLENH